MTREEKIAAAMAIKENAGKEPIFEVSTPDFKMEIWANGQIRIFDEGVIKSPITVVNRVPMILNDIIYAAENGH